MATSGGGISTSVSQVTELRLPDKAPQITQLVMAGPRPALGHLPVFDDAEVKVRELSGVKGSQQPHDFPKIILSVGIGDLGNKARPWMSAWRLSGTRASERRFAGQTRDRRRGTCSASRTPRPVTEAPAWLCQGRARGAAPGPPGREAAARLRRQGPRTQSRFQLLRKHNYVVCIQTRNYLGARGSSPRFLQRLRGGVCG